MQNKTINKWLNAYIVIIVKQFVNNIISKKYKFKSFITILFFCEIVNALQEHEVIKIAKELKIEESSLKKMFPSWQKIKNVQSLIDICSKRNIYWLSKNNISALSEVLLKANDVEYLKIKDKSVFNYIKLPISFFDSQIQPCCGLYDEKFILTIKNGLVFSDYGWIVLNKKWISDFIAQQYPLSFQIHELVKKKKYLKNAKKINGKVAVITGCCSETYGHWMSDILGRLILLENNGTEYDYLYVSLSSSFMKETFDLLEIPRSKILPPVDENIFIQADILIVPSLAIRRVPCESDPVLDRFGITHFWPKWLVYGVRSKFLSKINKNNDIYNFSKKIFISRKDASRRKIINEDEVFKIFEKQGFRRYVLGDLSLKEQIILFNQASHVAGINGSGLTNIMFCDVKAKVLEIFLHRPDAAFWNLAQELNLNYFLMNTVEMSIKKIDESVYVDIKRFNVPQNFWLSE